MDNHDQTKLEIAAAADEVAQSFRGNCGDLSRAISKAFEEFAEAIRERVSKEDHRD